MINAAQLQKQVADRDMLIQGLRADIRHIEERQENYNMQMQNLLFALLEKLGPKVEIEIPNFYEHMQDAQILGGHEVDDSGTFKVDIEFFLTGMPENQKPEPHN